MSKLSKEGFINFFKYYKGEAQQEAGIGILYDQMRDVLKDDGHRWIETYRSKPEVISNNPLDVTYQSQNDNASGTGYRECFSSSCAMVAMYYGKIANDDAYNLIRQKYGDSTDAQAQLRTLRSLGLEANFITNGNTCDIRDAIDAGRPVPVGWLHHGHITAPSGGGHYSVIVGYDETGWIVHDPNGEANLATGGYTNNLQGAFLHYSFGNFNPRWVVEGEGSGWYMDIRQPSGKKPEVEATQEPSRTSELGVELIKAFEGCELTAYVDAVGVLTIGYGHTGADVYAGQTISSEDAEALLRKDLQWFEKQVVDLIVPPFNQNEFDATVSFTFNVGAGALKTSTFRKRINNGEIKARCFQEEFPKWVNGNNGPLPGLVRRRDAEVELATS